MKKIPKKSAPWVIRYYGWLLAGILLFALATRLYRLALPREYVFDEVYHAVTAKLIRRNDPQAYEWWHGAIEPNTAVDWLHPPIAKYTQALSMDVFGENSFGWRFSAAIFGTGVIGVTALLADELFHDKKIALLAALLASLDGLLLTQSRIAMNDIHVTFFILLTLWAYIRFRQRQIPWYLFVTGVCGGLAMGSKWSGIFAMSIVWLFEAVRLVTGKMLLPKRLRFLVTRFLLIGLLPIVLYLLAYTHMFLQGKSLVCEGNEVVQGQCYCSQESSWWVSGLKILWPSRTAQWEALEARGGCKRLISHFSELHEQIWWYQTNLKATHSYQSRPLDWFFDTRPVWFYVNYGQNTIANIYAFGNPALFWLGDVSVMSCVGILGWAAFSFLQHKRLPPALHNWPLFSLCFLLVSYFAVWLPWQVSPRIMFFYHYTPAVPLLAITLAFGLHQLSVLFPYRGKLFMFATLSVIAAVFLIWYPNWTGIPVPTEFANKVYFFLPSWK